MDGGSKFCILKWPVVTWSAVNDKQQGSCVALGLVSSMKSAWITETIRKWNTSTLNATGKQACKRYGVSDAEDCFRRVITEEWGGQWIMCWFHVKQAVKKWVERNARFESLAQRRAFWKQVVEPELDKLHRSLSQADFKVRSKAITTHWRSIGADKATLWKDAQGQSHDIITYCEELWLRKPWCFPHRRILPATNNVSEAGIDKLRTDHGRIPSGAVDLVKFLLLQVEFHSKLAWDPHAQRGLSKLQWSRAAAIQQIMGSRKVAQYDLGGQAYFVCHAKSEDGSAERDRPDISHAQARHYCTTYQQLQRGEDIDYAALTTYLQGRIFWHDIARQQSQCTCWDFPELRRCKHVTGLDLHQNRQQLPREYDPQVLSTPRAANRPRQAGHWGSRDDGGETHASDADRWQNHVEDMRKQLLAFAAQQRDTILTKRRRSSRATADGRRPVNTVQYILRKRLRNKQTASRPPSMVARSSLALPAAWGERYFERQVHAHCGQHVLNNLLGCPVFTTADLHEIAADIAAETGEQLDDHMKVGGWYSHGVLGAALQKIVPPTCRMILLPLTAVRLPTLIHDAAYVGAIANRANMHWTALVKHGGQLWHVDSETLPEVISTEQLAHMLAQQPEIYPVVRADVEV